MWLIEANRLKEDVSRTFAHIRAKVMCQIIDKQPTAYDIEEKINRIEKLRTEAANIGAEALLNTDALLINYTNGQYNAYGRVINILRGEQE